jgi:EmrB/QacA subfamily drug resistance transporter
MNSKKWLPLAAIGMGAFMLLVDVTIVTVALPDMAKALDTSFSSLQWVMDVYALVLAAMLLGAGSLADRIGRRKVYVGGLVLFAASSLACGLAPNAGLLIAARGVQGLGGAAMLATTMALLNATYQGRDRGVAFGIWGAINGAAAAAGPILGGLLTQQFGWRSIFLVNIPISIGAVVLTLKVLKESRNPKAGRIDLLGMITFTAAATAITFALIRTGTEGWTSTTTLGLFAAGAVAMALFVLVEVTVKEPMLDLRLFRNGAFTGIMIAAGLLTAAAFAYGAYLSLWLQSVLGLSAIQAGLVMLPMSVVAFLVAAIGGRVFHEASPRLVIGVGLLIIGAGAFAQAILSAGSSWFAIMPGLAVAGIGVGLATPALSSAGMAAVAPERGGMASGAVNTFRQLGYAFGIAVLGSVFRSGMTDSLHGDKQTAGALSGGQAQAVIARSHGTAAHTVHAAFASGLDITLVVAGVLGIVAGLISLALIKQATPPAQIPTAAPEAKAESPYVVEGVS